MTNKEKVLVEFILYGDIDEVGWEILEDYYVDPNYLDSEQRVRMSLAATLVDEGRESL